MHCVEILQWQFVVLAEEEVYEIVYSYYQNGRR